MVQKISTGGVTKQRGRPKKLWLGIYEGYEWDIPISKNRTERKSLLQELTGDIRKSLNVFKRLKEEAGYAEHLTDDDFHQAYEHVKWLTESLGKLDEKKFGCSYGRIGRRLGKNACQRRRDKLCREFSFTFQEGKNMLEALQPRFDKIKAKRQTPESLRP